MGWLLCAAVPVWLTAGLIRADEAMVCVALVYALVLVGAWCAGLLHARQLAFDLQMPRHAVAGQPFRFRLYVRNEARFLPVWRLRVEVTVENAEPLIGEALWIPPGGCVTMDLETACQRRGLVRALPLTWETDFPFGLMQGSQEKNLPVDLVIRPRPLWPWHHDHPGSHGMRSGMTDRPAIAAGDGEPRGMRFWRAGDKPRAINWAATLRSLARGASWMVREADPLVNGGAGYTVVFHSYGGGRALIRPGHFEHALRHVAGLLKRLCAEGQRVRLVADFNQWVPWDCHNAQSLSRVMDLLAGASRAVGTEAHELTRALEAVPAQEGIIVLSDFPRSAWQGAVPASAARAWSPPEKTTRRPSRKEYRP